MAGGTVLGGATRGARSWEREHPPVVHGALPAEHGCAADRLQRPLLRRSRFQQLLSASVSAPSEAWCFLQGASPCGGRSNQPLLPSVAPVEEVKTARAR
jgi:hypothetical protein